MYLLEKQETERLKFRLVEETDFDTWVNLFNDEIASKFVALAHLQTPGERCKAWFERVSTRYKNGLGGMNALIDKQTNELVGQAGLLVQVVNGISMLEVGYSMLPQYRNKGYATEAAVKCRNYAFENDFADSLISIIHIENTGSMKVAANNGMQLSLTTEFKDMPVHIFRITKQEWQEIS